ncbi:MAG: HDOD domain-containing protein [Gammaproteobacteria bacterium]|nr:HDOD domain-containing protein [Gammaproteobacteria bacterium]
MDAAAEEKFLDKLLDDLENDKLILPTLPEVALRVRDTLEDENSSLLDVAKIITSDAALSARMIQVSNSPLLRAANPIESVEAAVTRMGSNMIRNLVTSMVMEQMFQATSDVTDKRLRKIWEHSTEVAAIAHALASQFTKLQPEQAMLAGLIHDIGALPILTRAEDHPELLEDEATLDRIIESVHSTIGAEILRKWNFPEELIAVAEQHEDLEHNSENGPDYVDVVIVANLQSLIDSNHRHTKIDWNTVPAFSKLGLQADVSVVDMDETNANIEAARAALS